MGVVVRAALSLETAVLLEGSNFRTRDLLHFLQKPRHVSVVKDGPANCLNEDTYHLTCRNNMNMREY